MTTLFGVELLEVALPDTVAPQGDDVGPCGEVDGDSAKNPTPNKKTPRRGERGAFVAAWPGAGYLFRVNCPRSAFANRDSFPLVWISRIIAA